MIKVKSLSLQSIGLATTLLVISAYSILVLPKLLDSHTSSTYIFENTMVDIGPVSVSTVSRPQALSNDKLLPPPITAALPIIPPSVLYKIVPNYPVEARSAGLEGIVIIKAYVDKSGIVSQTQIKISSGISILDNAALSSVHEWKFSAAKRGAEAISSWLEIPFRFSLK